MIRWIPIILFILFFNLFFFRPWGPVAVVLQQMGLFTLFLTLFHQAIVQSTYRNHTFVYTAMLLLTSVGLLTRSSSVPVFLLHGLSLGLLLFFLYEQAVTSHTIKSLLELFLIPVRTGLEYLNGIIRVLASVFSPRETRPAVSSAFLPYRRITQSLLVGVLLGLPAVFILAALFSSADPVFARFTERSTRWLQNLLTADTWRRIVTRAILSSVLFAALAPILYFTRKPFATSLPSFARYRWVTEFTVALSMVATTVGTFLVIQWPYVFVSVPVETDLSRFGVATYSEYVTRGFFELVVASFFLYGLLWMVHILTREQPPEQRRFLRVAQVLVLALFAILIVSVFRRVYLYQSYHGWSLARIYGSIGLVWIGMMTATFAGRLITHRRWVMVEMASTTVLLLFAGLWNAEAFIVHTHPPTVNKRIDYVYLSRMSADGIDGWLQAFDWAQRVLRSETLSQKEMLDREDRRNIAYAGTVISHLTVEHDRLVPIYGSPEERLEYYLAMLGPLSRRTQDQQATEATRLLESSRTASVDDTTLGDRMYLYGWSEPVFYNFYSRDTYRFYDLWPGDPPAFTYRQLRMDRLSRLFRWNFADAQGYRILKEEIGYHQLARLQETFYTLYDRIITQPDNERDYEHDLSFRTPFLD